MTGDDLPRDPWADEDGVLDVLEDGERLLLLLVDAALDPGLGRLAGSMRGLSETDFRRIALAQAVSLARGIQDLRENRRGRGRLRRAVRAAATAWRTEWRR